MSKLHAALIICLVLCVPMIALGGIAKLGVLIVATAMMACITTLFYTASKEVKPRYHSLFRE